MPENVPQVLIAGLPASLSTWLARRLDASVEVAFDGDGAVETARTGKWSLLILDLDVPGLPAETVIQRLRERPDTSAIPVILAAEPPDERSPDRLERLVRQHGVERVLMHPVDRGELARQAADLMHRPLQPLVAEKKQAMGSMLDAIWNRSLSQIQERVDTVERALAAARAGGLDDLLRREGVAEAHRLAGIMGTLGAGEGSRLAREAELALEAGAEAAARLQGVAEALRAEVEARTSAASGGAPTGGEVSRDLIVVVGGERPWADELGRAAAAQGLRVRHVPEPSQAADYGIPAAALADLGEQDGDVLATLAGLLPDSALAVMAGRDSLLDRVQALQSGARTFIQKPVSPAAALEAVQRALATAGRAVPVLAIDDDPQVLDALRLLLTPDGVELHGETDPLRFWSTLQRVQPELLVLDVDMPQLNGIELCRVVRADPRWARLPVVFLTARADRDTLMRVFAAGADDYLTKPIVGPELSVRIRARLERARVVTSPRAAEW